MVAAMPSAAAQKAYIGRLLDRAAASYDRVGNALFAPAGAALVAAAALRLATVCWTWGAVGVRRCSRPPRRSG